MSFPSKYCMVPSVNVASVVWLSWWGNCLKLERINYCEEQPFYSFPNHGRTCLHYSVKLAVASAKIKTFKKKVMHISIWMLVPVTGMHAKHRWLYKVHVQLNCVRIMLKTATNNVLLRFNYLVINTQVTISSCNNIYMYPDQLEIHFLVKVACRSCLLAI